MPDEETDVSAEPRDPQPVVHERDGSAVVEVPGTTRPTTPGARADLVERALQDERVRSAREVTVAVPRGDAEAVQAAEAILGPDEVRPAGASVVVRRHRPRPPADGPDRVLALVNPVAGTTAAAADAAIRTIEEAGRSVAVVQLGAREQGFDGTVMEGLESLPSLVNTQVVVLGGDGTVSRVVAELERHRMLEAVGPIGLVPLGTGNDVARGAGIPLDPRQAVTAILDGVPRAMDVLRSDDGRLAVNAVHVGAGADATARAEPWKGILGPLAYPVGAALSGATSRGWPLRVTVDGRVLADGSEPMLMVAVALGRSIGGGTPVAPDTQPGSGSAEAVIVAATGPLARLGFATALRSGRHGDRDDVLVAPAQQVEFSGGPVPLNVDGEVGDEVVRQRWTVHGGAWSLLVPASSAPHDGV
jgi:diacylglycerol kinase family enzyme